MNNLSEHGLAGLKSVCILVALMWLVELVNTLVGHRLNDFGIYPRSSQGLIGVLLWPFLHGGLGHLIMNTTPLLFMGFFVSLRGPFVLFLTSLIVVVVGGLLVWVFGRSAIHIGASGLVFGYFGFLVAVGLYERSISALVIASGTLFYYGGMIVGVVPTDSFVSWEGHLFGLLAGILAARILAKRLNDSTKISPEVVL